MCSLGSIDDARNVFDTYDKNGDGKISFNELREALDRLGPKASSPEETKRMMAELDKDGDGHIDFGEFLELFRVGSTDDGNEALRDAFNYYDLDGNGLISVKELHSVLRKLGEKCSMSDCKRMIGLVDKDGDGNVNFEEFKEMMANKSSR